MPKMRILSGAQAGAILEMSLEEAQTAYCTGFAEQVVDEPKKVEAQPEKPQTSKSESSSKAKGHAKGA
jgi:hypothetical protein